MMSMQFSMNMGQGARRSAIRIAIVLSLLSSAWGQPAQDTPVVEPNPPSAEQIAQWVEQLDDNRFVVRTDATEKLIATGAAAVEPVRKSVLVGNLEVSTRAIYILREMAVSLDVDTQDQGLAALQE